MKAEVTHITKDITGEWRDIGALMDQWIQECPYNCACIGVASVSMSDISCGTSY